MKVRSVTNEKLQWAHEGKSSGSESGGLSDGMSTRLRGVAGEELGNAIGDELPTSMAVC